MNRLMRYWNQNRKGIIAFIVIMALLIIVIQIFNAMAKKSNNSVKKEELTAEEKELPRTSIITGEDVSVEKTKSNTQIIKDFVDKCNNKDIEGAYNLLTDECKQNVFPTMDSFVNNYYTIIFNQNKIYDLENYMNTSTINVYKIKFYDNALITGQVNEEQVYQDYISINSKLENGKLNINGFIAKREINKTTQLDGMKITVLSKKVYKDSEIYQVRVENSSDRTMMLNTNRKLKTVNIESDNGVKYEALITKIADNLLIVNPNMVREYEIEFNKIYNPEITIDKMNFEDIVDYQEFLNSKEVEAKKITINL